MADTIDITIRLHRDYHLTFDPPKRDLAGLVVTGDQLFEALDAWFERREHDSDMASEVIRLTKKVGNLSTEVAEAREQHQSLIQSIANLSTLLCQPRGDS